ncbi:MAG TPA: hypothetical protein VF074_15080 [Pyrinomonadaceae bacterium]
MNVEPHIIPLDTLGNIYAVSDGNGKIAGTGTREVCEVMIYLIRKLRATNTLSDTVPALEPRRRNVRAAMTI